MFVHISVNDLFRRRSIGAVRFPFIGELTALCAREKPRDHVLE
jgi:hypothetical protein